MVSIKRFRRAAADGQRKQAWELNRRFDLAGGMQAPAAARQAIAAIADSFWNEASDVCLLVSELVTNSVRHAGVGPDELVSVCLAVSAQAVRVDVINRGTDVGHMRPGRGFKLVDAIADRWGIFSKDETRVWFELDRRLRARPQ